MDNKTYNIGEFFCVKDMAVPSKYNEMYQNKLKEVHEKYPELQGMGIYAIRYNGKLVYVGKATDIGKRWIAHTFNASSIHSKEHGREIYCALRAMRNSGEVTFEVLEATDDEAKLSWLEGYWINKLKPVLNKKIPYIIEASEKINYNNLFALCDDMQEKHLLKMISEIQNG